MQIRRKGGDSMCKSFLAQWPVRELFPGSGIVRRFAFRAIGTRGRSALSAQKDGFACLSPQGIAT
jgi:hypothetical protein